MDDQGSRPLFRQESIDAKRETWASSSHLPKNLSLQTAAWLSILLSLLILTFLILGEYTRRVRAEGVILPTEGLTRITAPAAGWIRESRVRDGDAVKQGDILYALSIDSMSELGGAQQANISLLRQRRQEVVDEIARRQKLAVSEKQQLADDLAYSAQELEQIGQHHALLTEFANTLEQNTLRQEDLIARGYSTLAQMETRQQAYMSYRLQLESLERDRVQLSARIDQMKRQLDVHDARRDSGLAELRQQLIEIDRQISEGEVRREMRVVAPRDGRVTALMAHEGQTVSAGAPMLTIVPQEGRLQGQLLVPGGAIGFVGVGDPVLMRYESFPYQRYGQFPGTITSISRTTLRPEELDQLVMGGSTRGIIGAFYRVTVDPDQHEIRAEGTSEQLQPGMQFEAHILTETRPLYQWLLSPLRRVTDSLARQ